MDEQNASVPPSHPGGGSGKIIGVVIGIILLAALGFWLMNSRKSEESNNQVASNQNSGGNQQTQNSNQTSMKELLASGKSQRCDMTYTVGDFQGQGIMYFGNGKVRGDFTAIIDGKTVVSHMISDNKEMYTWVDGENTGMKMAIQASNQTETNQQTSVDPEALYDYRCSTWWADNSVLNPPTNIAFTDMSAMMQNQTDIKAQQCAACDSAGANKAQCLAALGCQ